MMNIFQELPRVFAIAMAVALTAGCTSSDHKPVAPSGPAAPKAAPTKAPPAAATPAPTPAAKAPQPKAQPVAKKTPPATAKPTPKAPPTAAKPTPKPDPELKPLAKPYDRKTLEKAYLEIFCIQKKGQAAKLLEAYKTYGFADPKAWIRAWESQKTTKDYEQWLAALTQKAWKSCP